MSNDIAVIVLSHNDAQTITAALDSLAQQARSGETRVWLFDDASSDDTIERARHAAAGRLALEVITTQQNLGQWANLNRALRRVGESASWSAVLHADDWVAPGWLTEIERRTRLCEGDVASISCSWNTIFQSGNVEAGEHHTDEVRRIDASARAVADTLMRGCWWKISGAAIRLAAFQQTGDFDARFAHNGDWEWLLRALSRRWAFEYLPRSLVNYRQHAATVSTWAFRHDLDIRESLLLLQLYGGDLSARDRRRFLGTRARYVARRMARALANGDARRVGTAVQTSVCLARAAARSLF